MRILIAHGVADFIRRDGHGLAIAAHRGRRQLAVIGDKAGFEIPCRPEIQQHDVARGPAVLVIRKIGIGLHHAQFEQLGEHEFQQGAHHAVALLLRSAQDRVNGSAGHISHGQHVAPREIRRQFGQHEALVTAQHLVKAREKARFFAVVGFVFELTFGVVEQGLDIHLAR